MVLKQLPKNIKKKINITEIFVAFLWCLNIPALGKFLISILVLGERSSPFCNSAALLHKCTKQSLKPV